MVDREAVMSSADAIDLERVVVDPDYRRHVLARLRAEAARETVCEGEVLPVVHDEA